jgi:hypothetical protein
MAGGHRRCARQSNGIPACAYQSNEIRQRAIVASHIAPTIQAAGAAKPNDKLFQPLEGSLVVGDCALTQLRLLVDSDGNYVLSFRAANAAPSLDREPLPGAVKVKAADTKAAATRPISPVRHHRFQVTVRLFTGPEDPVERDPKRAGGVALAALPFVAFHVAPGNDLVSSTEGNLAAFRRHFAAATQAEFELEIDPTVTQPGAASRR